MTTPFEVRIMELREAWWCALTDDDRVFLIACAEADECPPRAVQLLTSHGSPHGPIGTQWEGQDGYAWTLTEPWRAFILARE